MPSPQEFIQQYGPQAAKVAQALKVDPAIVLGQWGLETGWGKSVVPGTNNLGNIKDFSGGGVAATDNMTGSTDKYRAYDSTEAFGGDFAGLIGRKYQGAIGSGSDAQKYASALKAGGYAEDPDYVPKLVAATDVVRKAAGIGNALSSLVPAAQAASGADLSAKIKAARDAGYSDTDIMQYLGKSQDFASKLDQARKAGYSDADIYGHLGLSPQGATDGPQNPETPGVVEGAARGFWQGLTDLPAGVGQSSVHQGQQILASVDRLLGTNLAEEGRGNVAARDAEVAKREADYQAATPSSTAAGVGRVAGVIASSLGPGGAIKGGAQLGEQLLGKLTPNALARLLGEAGTSSVVGAGYGATGPVTVSPKQDGISDLITGQATGDDYLDTARSNALLGAALGAGVPVAVKAIGGLASAAKNTTRNLVEPFSASGQQRIAERMVRGASDAGPTAINAQSFVPGSTPTLAQATGNPRIAALERGLRNDPRTMNDFVARDAANGEARLRALQNIAGTPDELAFHKAARDATADDLYGQAIANYTGDITPNLKGQITQLLKRPSIDQASRTAQRWAIERGEKPAPEGSILALHDVKMALDDMIGEATRAGKGGEVKALQGTKTKLLNVIERLSPEYGDARNAYAEMSQPINAMEALQGLKLTDAKGNITLAKVQNALSNLSKQRSARGLNGAKSLTEQQIDVLTGIRDDLLRAEQSYAGASRGSPTMQNIAIENLLTGLLPGRAGQLLGNSSLGGVAKRLGGVVYGGTDEQIRNRLAELLLDANAGGAAINRVAPAGRGIANKLAPYIDAAGTFAPVNFLSNRN